MSAVEMYKNADRMARATGATTAMQVVEAELADAAIDEQDSNMKSVIAIAKQLIPPEYWHDFCVKVRETLGRSFADQHMV